MASAPADGYRTDWLEAEQAGGGRAHVLRLLEQLRHEHRIEGQQVLELGSGLGDNLLCLQPGNVVHGVEGLADAARRAQARGIPTLVADLERPPWPLGQGEWDWILMLDVLEHLVRPDLALREARRLLGPGGRLVVNLPNPFDWRSRWRLLRGAGIDAPRYFTQCPPWRYPHLRFLRHGDVLDLLREAGFEPVADLSPRQASLPKARHWPRLAARVAARWPDLACSGFFIVARRSPAGAEPGRTAQ